MRILVLRGGAIGDFLVALPVAARLKERFPAVRIAWAGNAAAAGLGAAAALIDETYSLADRRWAGLCQPDPLPAEFAAFLGGFDGVVNFWPDPDGRVRRHFGELGFGAPDARDATATPFFLAGSAHPDCAPAARHFCRALAPLGIANEDPFLRLDLAAEDSTRAWLDGFPRPLIALHPGSGSPAKNWASANWAEVIRRLRQRQAFTLAILAGEAEEDRRETLERQFPGARFVWDRPLTDLAALLSRATLFLGHDSGLGHLAAAVGTRSLLLFGPTDPAIWAPPADHVHVLRGQPLAELSPETVTQSALSLLDARRQPEGAAAVRLV